MVKLSKEAESRLFGAVDQLLADLDRGKDPPGAIAQAMRQHRLGPGFAPLLAAAYNVGRALEQQDSGEGLLDKLASFPLADPAEVLEELDPEWKGTAAEQYRREVVSEDYSRPPRSLSPASPAKAAACCCEKAKTLPKRHGKAKSKGPPSADLGWKAARALDRFHQALGRVVDYFRQPSWRREKFATVHDWASWRWGKPAQRLLQYVPSQVKLAAAAEAAEPVDPDFQSPPYTLIAEALSRAEELSRVRAGLPKPPPPPPPPPPSPLLCKQSGSLGILGGAIGGFASRVPESIISFASPSEDVSGVVATLHGPQVETLKQSIALRNALVDMMAHDPIISGYHQDEVIRAYNELAKLAPRAMRQPATMRAYLRRHLTQGGLETFELADLERLEQQLSPAHRGMMEKLRSLF